MNDALLSQNGPPDEQETARGGLWRHRNFVKLWMGQTVSKFGTHITHAALAIIALVALQATPAQMGLLGAIGSAAFLILGLFAGAWVDRLRRRPILLFADLGRAVVLGCIPLLFLEGHLRIEAIYLVAGITGILDVFFSVADRAFLPSVVSRRDLVEANSKLGASDSVAEIAGPSLAGVLVQILSAPFAIVIDIATYLFSALCLGTIHVEETIVASEPTRAPILREIAAGWQAIRRNPFLHPLAVSLAILTFFGNFIGALYWLFLVRELRLSPLVVGIAIGSGGIGSLIGAVLCDRMTVRGHVGRTLWGSLLLWACVWPLLPLIQGPSWFVVTMVLATQLLGDIPAAIFFIHATSLRQSAIPHHLLGRANASIDFLTQGVGPLGSLLGGVLGGIIGIRATFWLTLLGPILALLVLYRSPIRHLSALPTDNEEGEVKGDPASVPSLAGTGGMDAE